MKVVGSTVFFIFFSTVAACFFLALPCFAAEPVEVVIDGIEGDALKNVREALELPYGIVNEEKVDRIWLERFVSQSHLKVQTALEPFGYYRALVNVVIEMPEPEKYRLKVSVKPGEPVRVTEARLELLGAGSKQEQLEKLAATFPLAKGSVLLQQEYEQAKSAIKSGAQQLGYLDAEFSRHEIRIAEDFSTARIDLALDTGGQYHFDGVRIEGAPDYPEAFLRRYLAFKPGEVFSYAKLGESQLNLSNSDRFTEALVSPERDAQPGKWRGKSGELTLPVLVQLKPKQRRSLRPGIGYGTDTGARFTLRYRDLNMFHLGHEFFTNIYIAERLQGLVSGYIVPDFRDIRSSASLQLNLQQEDVSAYESRLIALELARNRSFGKTELGTAYLKLQQEEFTIGNQNSSTRLVLPGLRLAGEHYDNQARPASGFRYAVDLRGTHEFLGSDTGLLQVIAEGYHILPLPWRLSLHTRAKAGITMLSDHLKEIPPTVRFFAGGDQSVRGYAYKSLGPRDASGQIAGGKHLFAGSAELERAIFERWSVSAFYDTGNAFDSFTNIGLFKGAGIGLHYYTPVGALNLSIARQIGIENPGYHIHFTVGFEL